MPEQHPARSTEQHQHREQPSRDPRPAATTTTVILALVAFDAQFFQQFSVIHIHPRFDGLVQ